MMNQAASSEPVSDQLLIELGLFLPGEQIAYKENELAKPTAFARPTTQFFIVNPVKDIYASQPGSLANVAAFRNIVVEFDKDGWGVRKQVNYVKRAGLPFSLATFSGNKSVHFIVTVKEGFSSLAEYTYYARLLYHVLGGAPDPKCKNANRLTRLPGAVRKSTGKVQALLERGRPLASKSELVHWLTTEHSRSLGDFLQQEAALELQQAIRRRSRATEEGPRAIPQIYQEMLESGALHPETSSRHDSLVKLGAWLVHNGYEEESVFEELMGKAADSLGIGGRDDWRNLVDYFLRRKA